MRDLFKTLLDEFLEERTPPTEDQIPRDGQWALLPRKATVITGVRRAGKSTALLQLAEAWKKSQNMSDCEYFKIDFTDERLAGAKVSDLDSILAALEDWLSAHPKTSAILLLFDEIQEIEGWERFVNRILQKPKYRVALSGSSAKMLSREIATQMRGRTLPLELFPFSLREMAKKAQIDLSNQGSQNQARVRRLVYQFLEWGGFPEVTLTKRPALKRRILQNYLEVLLLRDVIERENISQVSATREIQRQLISHYAAPFSIANLLKRIKAQGLSLDKNVGPDIVMAFEDAYAVFFVPIFAESPHRRQVNPRKTYVVDTGWATLSGLGMSMNEGRMLENAVFLDIRRNQSEVYYGKAPGGGEVDFVFREVDTGELHLVQCCWSLRNVDTRTREVTPLRELMKTHGIRKSTIVTFDEAEQIKVPEGVIEVERFATFCLKRKPTTHFEIG